MALLPWSEPLSPRTHSSGRRTYLWQTPRPRLHPRRVQQFGFIIRTPHKRDVTVVQSATGVVHLRGQRLSSTRSDRPPWTRRSQSEWTWRSGWAARSQWRSVWNRSHGSYGSHGVDRDDRSHWGPRAHRPHWTCWGCLWNCTHGTYRHHGSQRPNRSDGSHRSDGTHRSRRASGTHCADRG